MIRGRSDTHIYIWIVTNERGTLVLPPAAIVIDQLAIMCKNNEKNDKFYRKVAFLIYTEIVNFRCQSWKAASKKKKKTQSTGHKVAILVIMLTCLIRLKS